MKFGVKRLKRRSWDVRRQNTVLQYYIFVSFDVQRQQNLCLLFTHTNPLFDVSLLCDSTVKFHTTWNNHTLKFIKVIYGGCSGPQTLQRSPWAQPGNQTSFDSFSIGQWMNYEGSSGSHIVKTTSIFFKIFQ